MWHTRQGLRRGPVLRFACGMVARKLVCEVTCLMAAVTLSCSDGGSPPGGPPPPPAPYCTAKSGTNLKLVEVATGLERPVFVTAPRGDARIFVIEQPGRIRIIKDGRLLDAPFLDLTDRVFSGGDEQGLLGLAFHPRFAENGRFFVDYTDGNADAGHAVAEYTADPTSDTARTEEKRIFSEPDRFDNHNGGTLEFGGDGLLYISIGDGGAANDYAGNGQNKDSAFAKILRIDIDHGDPYDVPASNPWASGGGRPETFVWGLRNPWRFSIDPVSGNLFIGDVGQGTQEEIDVVPAGTSGQNFGWPVFEGTVCFTEDEHGGDGCDAPQSYVMPVVSYDRTTPDTGCSVVGGYVYRGSCMPDLVGTYFWGDYCTGVIKSFLYQNGEATDQTDRSDDLQAPQSLYGNLSSFGVDGYGELYVTRLGNSGPGAVYRIEVE